MSSVRVDSPLLSEFRRQPSPCAPTMPKPRACRKLFPVDHAETNQFLQAELAAIDAEQQGKMGIDLERGVPLEDQSSSRFTDWKPLPANSVPSFYHETFARSKPASRQRLPERASNSPRLNKNDSRSDNSTQNSAADATSPKPDETSPSVVLILETSVSDPNPSTTCNNQRHGTESAGKSTPSTSTSVVDKQLVDKQHTTQTQSKVTDYFRQRKRLPDTAEDGDKHQVPTKRRVGTNSPIDGGDTSPEVGQS